jgi:hypothetical protein
MNERAGDGERDAGRNRVSSPLAVTPPAESTTVIVDINDHATCASDGSASARSPFAASRSPVYA